MQKIRLETYSTYNTTLCRDKLVQILQAVQSSAHPAWNSTTKEKESKPKAG